MNVERKEESQQVQKPTEQSLCEAIENGLVDLVSEKKAFKAVTVEKLIEHSYRAPAKEAKHLEYRPMCQGNQENDQNQKKCDLERYH